MTDSHNDIPGNDIGEQVVGGLTGAGAEPSACCGSRLLVVEPSDPLCWLSPMAHDDEIRCAALAEAADRASHTPAIDCGLAEPHALCLVVHVGVLAFRSTTAAVADLHAKERRVSWEVSSRHPGTLVANETRYHSRIRD